jgi:histidine ammonia-lyase
MFNTGGQIHPGEGVGEAHKRLRKVVPAWTGDREPGPDLEAAVRLVESGGLADLAVPADRRS